MKVLALNTEVLGEASSGFLGINSPPDWGRGQHSARIRGGGGERMLNVNIIFFFFVKWGKVLIFVIGVVDTLQ